jgi:hypothetical protein
VTLLTASSGTSAAFVAWVVAAVAIVLFAVCLGSRVTHRWFGVLIDERGRVSLTHFQLALWTGVIVSLLVGVAAGRWWAGYSPFGVSIPNNVLGLLAISAGSGITATAVKRSKDATSPGSVATAGTADYAPTLWQMFLLETGTFADQTVDIAKFQQFIITLVVAGAYVAEAIRTINTASSAASLTSLPSLSGGFLVLLGISHAAYVGGKIPAATDTPARTPNMAVRRAALTQPGGGPGVGAVWATPTAPTSASQLAVTWLTDPAAAANGAELCVSGQRPFSLHYSLDQGTSYQDEAGTADGDSYSVKLTAAQLATAQQVMFTRQYSDGTADPATTTVSMS